jgi:hypothetical protein
MIDSQLNLAIETAREAAQRGDFGTAIETQERVITHLRLKAQTHAELVTLSVQMFNLADYYTGVERFAEAIQLLEQVVAFDERLGLPDVDSDRQMLEQVKQLTSMTPAARKQFYADTPQGQATYTDGRDRLSHLLDQVEGIEGIDRAELEQLVRELAQLSPEEQLQRVEDLRKRSDG